MSIIHDALKRVQQGLTPKTEDTQATPPPAAQNPSAYIYETPSKVETLPKTGQQQTASQKSSMKNKIKSLFALCCAIAITVASMVYIYQQVKFAFPKAQTFAKSSFFKLIHKKEYPDTKTKSPQNFKPLAQLTINPPAGSSVSKPAPITLNIHGIMSNGTGNLVLINDQVYQEGDEVDGAKIVKINLDSITVINNGTEQTIIVKN